MRLVMQVRLKSMRRREVSSLTSLPLQGVCKPSALVNSPSIATLISEISKRVQKPPRGFVDNSG